MSLDLTIAAPDELKDQSPDYITDAVNDTPMYRMALHSAKGVIATSMADRMRSTPPQTNPNAGAGAPGSSPALQPQPPASASSNGLNPQRVSVTRVANAHPLLTPQAWAAAYMPALGAKPRVNDRELAALHDGYTQYLAGERFRAQQEQEIRQEAGQESRFSRTEAAQRERYLGENAFREKELAQRGEQFGRGETSAESRFARQQAFNEKELAARNPRDRAYLLTFDKLLADNPGQPEKALGQLVQILHPPTGGAEADPMKELTKRAIAAEDAAGKPPSETREKMLGQGKTAPQGSFVDKAAVHKKLQGDPSFGGGLLDMTETPVIGQPAVDARIKKWPALARYALTVMPSMRAEDAGKLRAQVGALAPTPDEFWAAYDAGDPAFGPERAQATGGSVFGRVTTDQDRRVWLEASQQKAAEYVALLKQFETPKPGD